MRRQSIYVIGAKLGNRIDRVKIGIAGDVDYRISTLRVASPLPLFLDYAAQVDGDAKALERYVHNLLNGHRISGEWFKVGSANAVDAVRNSAEFLGYDLIEPNVGVVGIRPPFLNVYPDRHGKTRCYVRNRRDGRGIAITAATGTPEFLAEYHAAIKDLGLKCSRPSYWRRRIRTNGGKISGNVTNKKARLVTMKTKSV